MKTEITAAINTISEFLAFRQLSQISFEELSKKYCLKQVDLMMVLGSDLPEVLRIACEMYHKGVSKKIMFCGGKGHSTERLKRKAAAILNTDMKSLPESEAEIYAELAIKKYGISNDDIVLEKNSTNTAENIKFAMDVLQKRKISFQSIILLQDPVLQYRSYISAKEYLKKDVILISYAPFIPKITEEGSLMPDYQYLWEKERFFELLMGEIWRLRDDENGYGPRGKGYFGHVDIPEQIEEAYELLENELKKFNKRCL